MASPIIQFKRGNLADLPGLRSGEPGFTTDSYELYVGIDSTTANNQFVGSSRFWDKGSASRGSGVKLVEATSNGTQFIELRAPDSLSGVVTYTMPGTDGNNNQVLATNGSGVLSFIDAAANLTVAADSGSNDTVSLLTDTLTFAGTSNEIETVGSGLTITFGLPNDVTIGQDLTVTRNVSVTGVTTSSGGFVGNLTGNVVTTSLQVGSGIVTAILDEDDMVSDRDDALATQQSVKAYVDSQVTVQDLDIAGDSGTGAVDLDSQSLTIAGTANEIETVGSGTTLTIGLPDAVTVTTSLTTPTVKSTNVQANDGTTAITITDSTGAVAMANNLTITGDLIVNGSTTQVNTSQTTIEDQLLELGMVDGSAPSSDLNRDIGVLFNYFTDSAKKAGVYWDDSTSRIVVSAVATESTGVLTNVTSGALEIGSLFVNDCAGTSQVINCSGTTRTLENITIDGGTF